MMTRFALALAITLAAVSGARAQGVTVQGLPAATPPLAGSVVMWCGQGSVTRKCEITDILSALPNVTANVSVPGNRFYGGPSIGAGVPTFRALAGQDMPTPTASTLGGVFSNAGAAHRYVTAILTSGAVTLSQPSVADLAEGSTGSNGVVRQYAPTINGGLTLSTALTVANGGTGLTSGTSGGVPAYTASGTLTSSGALTLNSVVLGGGAGAVPKVSTGVTTNGASALSLGVSNTTTGQLALRGATSGATTFSAPSAAGSGNIIVPAASGTVAVSATSPLALDSSGNLTCATCATALPSPITNSIGGNIALDNTGNFFTGPTVAQGVTGTWFASGTVTVMDSTMVAGFSCKLWDGATVISSAFTISVGAALPTVVSLSGYITSPAGNIRISCKDSSSTNGFFLSDSSGAGKDGTLTAFRIQ